MMIKRLMAACGLAALMLGTSASAAGPQGMKRFQRVNGQACQGANYFNGGPVSDYQNTKSFLKPDVFTFWAENPLLGGTALRVPEVGAIDPQSGLGLPITGATPFDWVMGGLAQPFSEGAPDPSVLNVPLHEIPVIYDNRGVEAVIENDEPVVRNRRRQLPQDGLAGTPVRNAELNKPITVEEWNEADGRAYLGCTGDGRGWVRLRLSGLVPQMPYTAWEVFADNGPDFNPAPIIPAPLGGVPNTIIPDKNGRATYERDLHYCPLDTAPRALMYIAILLHSDQMVYGAYFDQGGLDDGAALPIGNVSADHVCIPVGNSLTP